MNNLRIAVKLAIGFGVMIVLVLLGAAMILVETRQSEARAWTARQSTIGAVTLADAESALWQLRYGFPQYMLGDNAARSKIIEDEAKFKQVIERALKEYEATRPGEAERNALKGLLEIYGKYVGARPKWFELYGAGKLDDAKEWRAATTTPFGAGTVKAFSELIALQQKAAQANHEAALLELQSTRQMMLALTVIGVIAGLLFAWKITVSVTGPLREAVAAARQVADGDLSVRMRTGAKNETGQLLNALSDMSRNLRSLVGEVAGGANSVSDTSAQIAQGNLDLSQRTEEQASTLEETASSLEELTSTVTQNAENARKAAHLAISASEVARRGGEAVGQVVDTMTEISAASRKIADIISVIDGIAFQTNILALNAAVEAARAGEQGRGFAVVAAEVRSLAQRSAVASKEIKTLIGDSANKVDAGTKLVDAAGKTMQEIVGSVEQVTELIAEIAAASQEQSSGIGQVNLAVAQMDQVVQQNASLVEEASAATESMKEQAGSLLRMVARFQLGDAQPGAAASAPVSAARRARSPAPIQLRPNPIKPATPPMAVQAAPVHAVRANGEWKEF